MAYGTDRQMRLSCMASRMQIGKEAQQKKRADQEGFSVSDLQQFLGTVGNKDLWHLVQ